MQIISHRGYGLTAEEKNTWIAFSRSFSMGFGTETDIRDYAGELVISHDVPNGNEITFEEMLMIYSESKCNAPLALNIKSDGLQSHIAKLISKYSINNYFLFDMSVPDAIASLKSNLVCYTRQSEYEREPAFYKEATGVWLDEFYEDWINIEELKYHLDNGKSVCIVSPELHKRDPIYKWNKYKILNQKYDLGKVTLCTDIPEEAEEYING